MYVLKVPTLCQGVDQGSAEEVHSEAAVFVDVVTVGRALPMVGIAGMAHCVDQHAAGGRVLARFSATTVRISLVDNAIHSSMCANTVSTLESATGNGSRFAPVAPIPLLGVRPELSCGASQPSQEANTSRSSLLPPAEPGDGTQRQAHPGLSLRLPCMSIRPQGDISLDPP